MKTPVKLIGLVILALILAAAVQAAELAYDLPWWTADGGGGSSQGGRYALSGTIGQPDAGVLQDGRYSLTGGFWSMPFEMDHPIYLPLLVKF